MPGEVFQTPLRAEMLDADVFAEWEAGSEKPIAGESREKSPLWLAWTADPKEIGWSGIVYGASKETGSRHLRIGFTAPLAIGGVLVRAGGKLSVLKPGVDYPGDLKNDADWMPAQRIVDGKISDAEVAQDEYALWVLPPGTTTRALRFTHLPAQTDTSFAGRLNGLMVLSPRMENIGPAAMASTASSNQNADKINNGLDGSWLAWENIEKGAQPPESLRPVSPEAPEFVQLTWPEPVEFDSLAALWAGFTAADVQIYQGPAEKHPRDAAEGDWVTVKSFENIRHGYPIGFWPNLLQLDQPVKTRAVRLRITAPMPEENQHPHVQGSSVGGRRVWLGELMALQTLGDKPLHPLAMPAAAGTPKEAALQPPIPVKFALKEAGFVTLAISDSSGMRVRNLISETWFPAGENTVWWDGMNDLERDQEAARHGIYKIPARFVAPGIYRVTGLVRGPVVPRYEFSIYSGDGRPAWPTADRTGAWLSNHTPPQAALFVPAPRTPNHIPMVYLGSYVSEGRDGLAWVDLEGRKQGGQGWVGGTWTGAPYLARDDGQKAIGENFAYAASVFGTGAKEPTKAELRLTALTAGGDKPVLRYEFDAKSPEMAAEIRGLAARDGILIASLPRQGQLFFADAGRKAAAGAVPLEDPRGILFDPQGRLLVLSGKKLLRFAQAESPAQLVNPETLVSVGLEDPQQLALDQAGNIYISDQGRSHQVKVYSGHPPKETLSLMDRIRKFFSPAKMPATPAGEYTLVTTIGKPGVPRSGPYDPLHMNHPAGLAVDEKDQLWVTENDFLPKRVSVWTLDGQLIKAFYGPSKYGGGGTIDPQDKTLFYYADEGNGTLEFKLDWKTGESKLQSVLYRAGGDGQSIASGYGAGAAPETAIYHDGQRFLTNCYNNNPTGGTPMALIFQVRDGVAVPAAGMGIANSWPVLRGEEFRSRWPEGTDVSVEDANKDNGKNAAIFIWSDLNADGWVQPDEVAFRQGTCGGVTVMSDLSFCASRVNGSAKQFVPAGFTDKGIPRYDMAAGKVLAENVAPPASSGGDQALAGRGDWNVVTLGIAPFPPQSISGAKPGTAKWSYPSLWPGLHAGHESPKPDRPGELVGTTRLLGGLIEPKGSDAGQLWALNSNHGHFYLFTTDGLFVATVFKDMRIGKPWAMPGASRDMNLEELTLNDENFWPTISQTSDGNVYVVDGGRNSVVRLDGLESVRRLPDADLTITKEDLDKGREWLVAGEAQRQRERGNESLVVSLRPTAPIVDGSIGEWSDAKWVDIDKSGVKAYFNSDAKPYDVTGALAVSGERLYAALRVGNPNLLQNTGDVRNAPFKTGGALDLMIGTDPKADPNRVNPVPGDARLIVTVVKGKPLALLYRAVVPGTPDGEKVPFSSPWRTITFDKVEDVTDQIQFAAADGNFEFSIPLSVLGLSPQPGLALKGDIGILRGNGAQTAARVYWSNKATGITADVPSEAMLTPSLWGTLKFEAP